MKPNLHRADLRISKSTHEKEFQSTRCWLSSARALAETSQLMKQVIITELPRVFLQGLAHVRANIVYFEILKSQHNIYFVQNMEWRV